MPYLNVVASLIHPAILTQDTKNDEAVIMTGWPPLLTFQLGPGNSLAVWPLRTCVER